MNKNIKKVDKDDYEMINTIGLGSFSRIRIIRHKKSKNIAVAKVIKKLDVNKTSIRLEHTKNEMLILNTIVHPLFVQFEGMYQDERYIYFVLEFVKGGDLFSHLRKNDKLDINLSNFYISQITLMLEYLHSKNIVYRDLKPENILMNEDGYLKLCDFSFAKNLENSSKTYTLCGTPEYIAPEVLLNKGHGLSVDLWGLGVLVFEILTGSDPFTDEDTYNIYKKIMKGKIKFPKNFDLTAKSLVKHLIVQDPSQRLGADKNNFNDLKSHRYFQHVDWQGLLQKKISAPYKPQTKNPLDTSNFSQYPESDMQGQTLNIEEDPFLQW